MLAYLPKLKTKMEMFCEEKNDPNALKLHLAALNPIFSFIIISVILIISSFQYCFSSQRFSEIYFRKALFISHHFN